MTLEAIGITELVLLVVVPTVGWLVRTVIAHGNALSAVSAKLDAQAEIDEQIVQRLDAVGAKLDVLHGDQRQVLERTDWLMRTTERHERFLEQGRLDKETP